MPPSQNAFDQFLRQLRRILRIVCQQAHPRQLVRRPVHEVHPVHPALPPDVHAQQLLLLPVPRHARHSAQPAGIPVLGVHFHAPGVQEVIQERHPFPVFVIAVRVHPHNGMHALFPAVDQRRHRQFQLPVHGDLLVNRHGVRFHQGKPEAHHVLVPHSFAVQGVEPDPRARFFLPVAHRCAQVVRIPVQGGDQLTGCAVIHALRRHPFSVVRLPRVPCHISHIVVRLKQRLKIENQVLRRLPCLFRRIGVAFVSVVFDHVVPVHHPVRSGKRRPSPVLRHFQDRRPRHSISPPQRQIPKRPPSFFTFPGMIPRRIPAAPFIPYAHVIPFRFQGHADLDPVPMVHLRTVQPIQSR